MKTTEQNLQQSKEFIRRVLAKNFNQTVDEERLNDAAEKLCKAIPEKSKEAA